MSAVTRSRAGQILSRFGEKSVLVIGDLMLDRFVWGEVNRISPEAPVPVVRVRRETATLGGSGNVVSNLAALGARVLAAGIVGDDEAGRELLEALTGLGCATDAVRTQPGRPTTQKTRVIAHSQQVVRVDREDDSPLAMETQGDFLRALLSSLEGADALVISDYDKGVISPGVLSEVLGRAAAKRIPVIVDPKLSHFALYSPVTILTPNTMEASRATAVEIRREEDVERAGRKILAMLETESLLITRGERGMSLFERNGPTTLIPARAREVYDVTGAGDTVVAALTLAIAAGATIRESAEIANVAAGIVVSKLGTAVVGADELLGAIP